MREPVIVDTSVWIDFFKGSETEQVKILVTYIEEDEPIYLCHIAQYGFKYNLKILHKDRDFDMIIEHYK